MNRKRPLKKKKVVTSGKYKTAECVCRCIALKCSACITNGGVWFPKPHTSSCHEFASLLCVYNSALKKKHYYFFTTSKCKTAVHHPDYPAKVSAPPSVLHRSVLMKVLYMIGTKVTFGAIYLTRC